MKIFIKTLQGKTFELQVSDTQSVKQTKEQIKRDLLPDFTYMKLIIHGKVMEDENKKFIDYGIKEGDFIVIMKTTVRYKMIKIYLG